MREPRTRVVAWACEARRLPTAAVQAATATCSGVIASDNCSFARDCPARSIRTEFKFSILVKEVTVTSGLHPSTETRKLVTGYHSLTNRCQRFAPHAYWWRLVKRRRALLESNPPRNSRSGNSSWTMGRARAFRRVLYLGPRRTNGRRPPGPGFGFYRPHRTDTFLHS